MSENQIKELYYSNGHDVFGPVSFDEFCKNRYYKSTMIWYEGLPGWINIADCKELEHLIGTMSSAYIDQAIPNSLNTVTPPLSKTTYSRKADFSRYVAVILVLTGILFFLAIQYFTTSMESERLETLAATMKDSLNPAVKQIAQTAGMESEKKTYRINWQQFIKAAPSELRKVEIGGIKDLSIALLNNSPFFVDSVRVKLNYIKANGDVYQSELLRFDNIDAKGKKELFAPDSKRGVRVDCVIEALYSSEMNLCLDKTSKQYTDKPGEDVHLCK